MARQQFEGVKLLRSERNMTQKELAEKAGIDRITLYRIEKNQARPNSVTLTRLAEALNINLDEFARRIGLYENQEPIPNGQGRKATTVV